PLHRPERARRGAVVGEQHLSRIPLSLYFKDGRAKVELALARGRKTYDQRQVLAKRAAERERPRGGARAGAGGARLVDPVDRSPWQPTTRRWRSCGTGRPARTGSASTSTTTGGYGPG